VRWTGLVEIAQPGQLVGDAGYDADGATDGAADGATDGALDGALGLGAVRLGAADEAGLLGAADGATDGTTVGATVGVGVGDVVQAPSVMNRDRDRVTAAIARFIGTSSRGSAS